MQKGDSSQQDYSAGALARLADALHNVSEQRRKLEAQGGADPAEVRNLLKAARSAFAELYSDYGGQAEEAAPSATLAELITGYWKEIDARKEAAPTGLSTLDEKLNGGFQSGRLVVLLGAPGSGKTTFANQLAEHIANGGRPVVYVTSEDTPTMLLAKNAARLGGLDYSVLLRGYRNRRDDINRALAAVAGRLSAHRLRYVHDTGGLGLEEIQERAAKHFAEFPEAKGGGPGLLVIDYLQRLARSMRLAGGQQMELREQVTHLTERLRAVGRELDCTILALASQNRANGYGGFGKDGGQPIASAKESGDIEYTADVMLALSKLSEKKDKGGWTAPPGHEEAGLRIVKNRQGESDTTIVLDWYGARQQFTIPEVQR